jgi:hypothetical protein
MGSHSGFAGPGSVRALLLAAALAVCATAVADMLLALSPVAMIAAVIGLAAACVLAVRRLPRLLEPVQSAVLLLASLLVALAAAEATFRLALVSHKVPVSDEEFRTWVASAWPHPVSEEKPQGTFRILGLSDSFGWIGGADNYHFRLERALRDRGCNVEVVNFSAGEFEPSDELEVLRRFGPRYEPDLILHGFFVGNDFDVHPGPLLTFKGISVRPAPGLGGLRFRNFALLHWMSRYRRAERHARRLREEAAAGDTTGNLTHERFLEVERRGVHFYRRSPPPERRWRVTMRNVEAIRETAVEFGARYALVIHPDRLQVEDALQEELFRAFGMDRTSLDLELPQRFLMQDCARAGLPGRDLLPAFRREGRDGGLYRFRDTHYAERGQALATEEIVEFLKQEGLVPGL